MNELQAVVFDFDGLMFDSEDAEFQAWSSVFLDYGVELAMSEWCKCVGGAPGIWVAEDHLSDLVPEVDKVAAFDEYKIRRDELLLRLDLKEGVRELVDSLHEQGIRRGVASSSRHVWVDSFVRSFGIDHQIECIWTRDKAGKAKPHPDVYLRACEELGADPTQSVAVEDSPNGCLAARAAGMKVVGCPNNVTRHFFRDELCDLKVETLANVDVQLMRDLVGKG